MQASPPNLGGLSMESDTLEDILMHDAVVEQLAAPTGDQMNRVASNRALPMNQAKRLSALDLNLPAQLMGASAQQLQERNLSGYQALQVIRDETAKYRRAYSDWRRGAAKGARGEASLKPGEIGAAPMRGSIAQGMQIGGSASANFLAPIQPARPSRTLSPKSGHDSSRVESRASSGLGSGDKDERAPGLGIGITDGGDVFDLEYDSNQEGEGGEDDAKGNWLKFSFNPFSEMRMPTATTASAKPAAVPLCNANLPEIAAAGARNLAIPASGSRHAASHIAHIGVGGFHRSHLAFVTDVLMQKQHAGSISGEVWGIIGVGLMPWDKKMYDVLTRQDCLYSLLLRGNEHASARVIGSLVDYVFVPDNPDAALARLCEPSVKIISLTVTEKGYYRNVEGELDLTNALVREDVDAWPTAGKGANGLLQPKTAFGLICTVLQRRRTSGLGPLTVLSCDNMPMNGSVCKLVTLKFAHAVDASLARWIEDVVMFPNSMVDRITPATEDAHRSLLREEYGIEDEWPVIAEPFLQWVIEDAFACGRPQWQLAMPNDVLVTSNVEPYELMKLRLLNSTHSALSYAAMLCEHTFVDDALADPDVFAFLRSYMLEVVRTLSEVKGVDLADYQRLLLERFSNRYIKDKLSRLAQDGSQKFMNTLQDALLGYRDQQAFVADMVSRSSWLAPKHKDAAEGTDMVALALATFMRYAVGVNPAGEPLVLDDPQAKVLQPIAARAYKEADMRRPAAVQRADRLDATRQFVRTIFGDEVAGWDAFTHNVAKHAEAIQRTSCRVVLRQCRHAVLKTIRSEIASAESTLKELRNAEKTLTSQSEREAAERFYAAPQPPTAAIRQRSPTPSSGALPVPGLGRGFPRVNTAF